MASIENHHGTEPIPLQDTPESYRTGYRDGYARGLKDGAKIDRKDYVMTVMSEDDSNSKQLTEETTKKEDVCLP